VNAVEFGADDVTAISAGDDQTAQVWNRDSAEMVRVLADESLTQSIVEPGTGVCTCDTVCTCNTVCSCDTVSVCSCDTVRVCICNTVCTCDSQGGGHYWYPN